MVEALLRPDTAPDLTTGNMGLDTVMVVRNDWGCLNLGIFLGDDYCLGVKNAALQAIEFGKDGQPFYCQGSYDNFDKIIATIDKSVDKGNYH